MTRNGTNGTLRGMPDDETVQTTLRLPVRVHEELTAIANSNHRSLQGELRYLIDRHIAASQTAAA